MAVLTRSIHKLEDYILISLLLSMILLAGTDILARWIFGGGISWVPPLLRVMVLWLGLLGALLATRSREHIAIDVINRMVSPKVNRILQATTQLFAGAVCLIIAYHSQLFVQMAREFNDIAFAQIPAWPMQVIIPFAFTGMGLRFLNHCRLSLFAGATS